MACELGQDTVDLNGNVILGAAGAALETACKKQASARCCILVSTPASIAAQRWRSAGAAVPGDVGRRRDGFLQDAQVGSRAEAFQSPAPMTSQVPAFVEPMRRSLP